MCRGCVDLWVGSWRNLVAGSRTGYKGPGPCWGLVHNVGQLSKDKAWVLGL